MRRDAGLMKIPEDKVVRAIWPWIRQQYARLLVPYLQEPRLGPREGGRWRADMEKWNSDIWTAKRELEEMSRFSRAEDEARILLKNDLYHHPFFSPIRKDFRHHILSPLGDPDKHMFSYQDEEIYILAPDHLEIDADTGKVESFGSGEPAGEPIWGVRIEGRGRRTRRRLQEVLDFIDDEIAKSLDDMEVLADETAVDMAQLKRRVLEDAGTDKVSEPEKDQSTVLRIDSPEWPEYGISLPGSFLTLAVVFRKQSEGEKETAQGWWNPTAGGLSVLWKEEETHPADVAEYERHLDRLRDTTEHEVRHMLQTYGALFKGLDSKEIGMPPRRVRTPRRDPSGFPVDQEVGPPLRLEHPLRDVEYHTRLGDEASRLSRELRRFPKREWRAVFLSWVGAAGPHRQANPGVGDPGFAEWAKSPAAREPYKPDIHPSHFFSMLKQHQPAKWREAVKQLHKAVLGSAADDSVFKSAGLMKVPEHDPTVRAMEAWFRREYARILLPRVRAPRLTKEQAAQAEEWLEDWLEEIARAKGGDEEARNALASGSRDRLPVFGSGGGYKVEPVALNRVSPSRWALYVGAVPAAAGSLDEVLDKMETLVRRAYHRAEGFGKEELSDLSLLAKEVEADAGGSSPPQGDRAEELLDVDPGLWAEYGVPRGAAPEKVWVQLRRHEAGDKGARGYWIRSSGGQPPAIVLLLDKERLEPEDLHDYREAQQDIRRDLRHELRHMVQDLASQAKGLAPDTVGLPPKKTRSPDYTPQGFRPGQKQVGLPGQPHALIDVEFHTRLADEVEQFRRAMPNIPPERLVPLMKAHIRSRHFFRQLLEHQPMKWREAVKQFHSAIVGGVDTKQPAA